MVCETTEKNEIKLKYLTLVHEAYAFQNKGCVWIYLSEIVFYKHNTEYVHCNKLF